MLSERTYRHVLDRFGLWDEARRTPPRDEFGPLVNFGWLQVSAWCGLDDAREFVASCSRAELACFIALLGALGAEVMPAFEVVSGIIGRGAAADLSNQPPRPELWPLLLRLAPDATLNDLADALFDQGFVVDLVDLRPLPAHAITEAATRVPTKRTRRRPAEPSTLAPEARDGE